MRQFGASITVPAAPPRYTDQLIYIFTALETREWNAILQPVLQFGVSPAGGWSFWGIASWFGGDPWGGNYYHSPLYFIDSKENPIRGGIWRTDDCNPAGCVWHVAACGRQCTEIAVRSDRIWSTVFSGAVEVYKIDGCDKYPGSHATFSQYFLQDEVVVNPTPRWTPNINVNTCRERIEIFGDLTNMYYGSP
jgi:hypothetical protein